MLDIVYLEDDVDDDGGNGYEGLSEVLASILTLFFFHVWHWQLTRMRGTTNMGLRQIVRFRSARNELSLSC